MWLGSCGTCKMTLVEGEVETLFPAAPAISPRDARRARILACQSTATSDVVIKPTWVEAAPRDGLGTRRQAAVLTAREELGPAIFRLQFRVDRPVEFREGQHAVIDLGAGLRRCYSMSNRPGSTAVEFIMKRYRGRPGSEAVSDLAVGAKVILEMPYGDMWIRDSGTPVCLVAGGTGIAPILGMLHRLADEQDPRPVRVVYGANVHDELVCWQDLATLILRLPDAELIGALTNPHDRWDGTEGRVTHALEPLLARPCRRRLLHRGAAGDDRCGQPTAEASRYSARPDSLRQLRLAGSVGVGADLHDDSLGFGEEFAAEVTALASDARIPHPTERCPADHG